MSEAPRRSPWPFAIAGVLLIVVAANVTLILIARGDPQLMETENYYEHALAYDEVIEARVASEALGWSAEVAPGDGQLEYALKDRAGAPVTGLKGDLKLKRQDTTRFDQEIAVREVAPGLYRAEGVRGTGLFHLRARLEGGGAPWVDERWISLR